MNNLVVYDLVDKEKVYKNRKTIMQHEFANKCVSHVEFPDCLEIIGSNAFNNCTSLKEVKINHTVKIDDKAFCYCSKLKEIDISTPYIPMGCFYEAGSDFGVDVNLRNVCIIEDYAFYNVTFKSLHLPDSLYEIGECAFRSASFKQMDYKLILPENVEWIKNNAFALTEIKDIYLPDSIQSIGNLAEFNINIHVSKETAKRLGLSEKQSNVIIDSLDNMVESLIDKMSFRDVNKIMLNSEIAKN